MKKILASITDALSSVQAVLAILVMCLFDNGEDYDPYL